MKLEKEKIAESTKYKLELWTTFKKRENPQILEIRGDEKWWIKETILPTMRSLCWSHRILCDYGYIKPKEIAIKLINEELLKIDWIDKSHFVYSFTKGQNGYMDSILVFYKIIKQ